MKPDSLKKILLIIAVAASMTVLTSCLTEPSVERVSPSGYLSLEKGQTFKAPRKMILAEEFVIKKQQDQILDLIEALRKAEVKANLRDCSDGDGS